MVNPANPYVLDPHLACAAYEQPLAHRDERWWGTDLDDGVRRLVIDDRLLLRPRYDGTRAVWAARGRPANGMGLRSGSSQEVRIAFADGTIVGTVDRARACDLVHPGAVYLHQGRPHRVVELDLGDGAAIVEPDDGREYTQARTDVALRITGVETTKAVGRLTVGLGTVEVTSRVTGYQRREVLTGEVLGTEELDLPPSHLTTRGVWWSVPDRVVADAAISPRDLPGALHAAEHAGIGILPLFTICDRWDVGGISTAWLDELGTAAVVIYDGYPGGAGIAELGYEAAALQLGATLEVLVGCGCDSGCPSCVQSPKCGSWNEPLSKSGAAALLRAAGIAGRPPTAPDRDPGTAGSAGIGALVLHGHGDGGLQHRLAEQGAHQRHVGGGAVAHLHLHVAARAGGRLGELETVGSQPRRGPRRAGRRAGRTAAARAPARAASTTRIWLRATTATWITASRTRTTTGRSQGQLRRWPGPARRARWRPPGRSRGRRPVAARPATSAHLTDQLVDHGVEQLADLAGLGRPGGEEQSDGRGTEEHQGVLGRGLAALGRGTAPTRC